MKLAVYVAAKKRSLFDRLCRGLPPDEGTFDETIFRECLVKGGPQIGPERFEPSLIHLEFLFSAEGSSASVLTVTIPSPQRIVYMPVPNWVIESIWQGSVDGTYHFEADAEVELESFSRELQPGGNEKWFGKRAATRRE